MPVNDTNKTAFFKLYSFQTVSAIFLFFCLKLANCCQSGDRMPQARSNSYNVLVEITSSEFKNVMFEIKPSSLPGGFDISAKFLGVKMDTVQVIFQVSSTLRACVLLLLDHHLLPLPGPSSASPVTCHSFADFHKQKEGGKKIIYV